MTFNIHGGQGGERWRPTRRTIRSVVTDIRRADPDVLVLQEVDLFAARSLWRNQPRYLRRRLKPSGFTAAAPVRRLSGRSQNLVIMTFHGWLLSSPQKLVFRGSDVSEPRSALAATVTSPDREPVLVVTAHLTGGSESSPGTVSIQDREIGGIAAAVSGIPGPVIFAGDTNTRAASDQGGRERTLLADAGLIDVFTELRVALDAPDRATDIATAEDGTGGRGAVDHIYVSRHWIAASARPDRTAISSDHFPVIADLRL